MTPGVFVDDDVTSDGVDNVGNTHAVDSEGKRKRAASTNSPLPHPRRLQTLDDHEDEVWLKVICACRVPYRSECSVFVSGP